MTGNAMAMGYAIALAQSLGMNRSPLAWPLTDVEKSVRVRVWWVIMINDRWCSFAYGTPPHIHRGQYDVPLPLMQHLSDGTPVRNEAGTVFISLCTLTEVLGLCLEHTYALDEDPKPSQDKEQSLRRLEVKLDHWEESLPDTVRLAVIRGIHCDAPGVSSLRLSYLAVRLLIRRIDMDMVKRTLTEDDTLIFHKQMLAQRAAEDIVFYIQNLEEHQIRGFWLATSAFILASAATFLVRCALETNSSPDDLGQSRPLQQVQMFLASLQSHRDRYGWDVGDICLAQCTGVVDRLTQISAGNRPMAPTLDDAFFLDMSLPDDLFPSLWDVLNGDALE